MSCFWRKLRHEEGEKRFFVARERTNLMHKRSGRMREKEKEVAVVQRLITWSTVDGNVDIFFWHAISSASVNTHTTMTTVLFRVVK